MQEQGIARRFSVGQIFAPWKEFYYGRLVRIPKTTDVALASQTASAYPLAQLASFNIRPNFSLFLYRLTQSEVLKYVAKKTFLPICLCPLQLQSTSSELQFLCYSSPTSYDRDILLRKTLLWDALAQELIKRCCCHSSWSTNFKKRATLSVTTFMARVCCSVATTQS